MHNHPELIVMLTYNDYTIENAYEIFDKCKNTKAEYWGFKEKPFPLDEMKALFSYMKSCGKKTVLEVVEYTEEECLAGAKNAALCGCDILMGTCFFDSVNEFCIKNNIKYMPFVGKVTGRPSVLDGNADEIIAEAKAYVEKGVFGLDLLGYRYTGDKKAFIEKFLSEIDSNVCIAGSVDSFERLDELKRVNPWAFTVGGAFFENKFGNDLSTQIDTVYEYMKNK